MNNLAKEPPGAEPWLGVLRKKVAAIRFGSVQITVHDGRVTQVKAIEKTRITPESTPTSSQSTTKPRPKSLAPAP